MHTTKEAHLAVAKNQEPAKPIVLKGVCYSPAPLNASNEHVPAIGDWFWDQFTVNNGQTTIYGWDALWKRDLDRIRDLGVNTIRVYCMLSRQKSGTKENNYIPIPWNSGQLFTHNRFLDLCWNNGVNPLYVLVGIPLPAAMFWREQYAKTKPAEIGYWQNVLSETAKTVGKHPAVMGFTIQNEQDGADPCYNNKVWADFWWAQANDMARRVQEAAQPKLVGMAVHDDPKIPGKAAQWMEKCPYIDFWGVNPYQTVNFDPTFYSTPDGPGYAGLKGHALKPVILTEFGIPAPGHRDRSNASTIYEDQETRNKAAEVVGRMLPQAFDKKKYPLCAGLYYFEYCDEWWNQPGSPNIYTWWGGTPSGFPNGFWDQDGFGLYSIRRGDGLKPNDDPWDGPNNRPRMPVDIHTERKEITAKVRDTYRSVTAMAPPAAIAAEV